MCNIYGYPGTGVMDGYDYLESWEPNPDPLQEQVLITPIFLALNTHSTMPCFYSPFPSHTVELKLQNRFNHATYPPPP